MSPLTRATLLALFEKHGYRPDMATIAGRWRDFKLFEFIAEVERLAAGGRERG